MSETQTEAQTEATNSTEPLEEETKKFNDQYYYSYAYGYDYLTLAVPFLLALLVFYLTYFTLFKLVSHRIRAKKLVARQVKMLKVVAFILLITSVSLIIAYGKFNNEFLRITLIISCLAFTYYSYLHWMVRWCSIVIHIFIIVVMETSYLRELILQLACFEIGQCRGGSSFEQLDILASLKLNNGSILVDGSITYRWAYILFWRTFVALICHYLAVLTTLSLSLKLGVVSNQIVETQIEEILERPAEDSATMFSFVKQQFFHKSLAYTKYEKSKGKNRRRCC